MRWARNILLACTILAASVAAGEDKPQYEWTGTEWVPIRAPQPGTPEGDLYAIRRLIEDGRNRRAVSAAEDFIEKHPDAPQREEAMMLAAEAEYSRGRYMQSYEWCEKQLAEFPAGRYYERALQREYDVAEQFLAGKPQIVLGFLLVPAQKEGLEILQRISEHAPGTTFAEEALMRVGDYHYARHDWQEAIDAYDQYVEMFAKTRRAPEAMLQAARAMFNSFHGPAYDDTPLLEAAIRFRAFGEAFPQKAAEANIDQYLQQIRDYRAQKSYQTGAYYQRTGRPAAAAFYYRRTRQEFPSTPWAQKAEAGAEQVKSDGAPEESVNRMLQGPASQPASQPKTQPAEGKGGQEP